MPTVELYRSIRNIGNCKVRNKKGGKFPCWWKPGRSTEELNCGSVASGYTVLDHFLRLPGAVVFMSSEGFMRLFTAIRAFFAVLFSGTAAACVKDALLLHKRAKLQGVEKEKVSTATVRKSPLQIGGSDGSIRSDGGDRDRGGSGRSDGITLLALLQKESRLIDLILEDMEGYSDEQIGGAARRVLRDARECLQTYVPIEPLVEGREGEVVRIPDTASPLRWRLLGDASASSGTLMHAGWIARKVQLPDWTGSQENSMIISPAEVDATSRLRLEKRT